jgi:O-acetyl-ADP-ribose deacetylase (regulator of RNase III)
MPFGALTVIQGHAKITDMNQVIQSKTLPNGVKLEIVHGDITQERVEVIINAANEHLQHGGGVAGAISRRGGPQIQKESNDWVRQHGPVAHDKPAYTSAGNLPSRYVIHAVGPVWGSGNEDSKLTAAVRGSLALANELKLSSLSIPAISTGVFGFPKKRAASLILEAIQIYFKRNPKSTIRRVRITIIDIATLSIFSDALSRNIFSDAI